MAALLSKSCPTVLRKLFWIKVMFNIHLLGKDMSGEFNDPADKLS